MSVNVPVGIHVSGTGAHAYDDRLIDPGEPEPALADSGEFLHAVSGDPVDITVQEGAADAGDVNPFNVRKRDIVSA